MWDTRSVELTLDLPVDLAESVEEVRTRDPEYLHRVIRYAIARRAVYRALHRQTDIDADPGELSELAS